MPTSPSIRNRIGVLFAAFVVGLTVAVVLVFGRDWFRPSPVSSPTFTPPAMGPLSTPFIMPGLQRPPTLPAAAASLPDDVEVLGVSSGRRHRAYLISALSGITSHIVNDVLDDVPVTVTFCDRSQCARVFTAQSESAPLKVELGGILDDRMLLRLNDVFYDQASGSALADREGVAFPYPQHPFERTTWAKWREKHPNTDIWVGNRPEQSSADGKP